MTGSSRELGVPTADSGEPDIAETTARYLADELSAADAAAFEARVAAEPQIYRDIDFSLRLKEGLATLEERAELAPLMTRDRRRVFAAAAIAAAMAVLVGVVWFSRTASHAGPIILARARAELLDESGKPLPLAGRVTLVRTRGLVQADEVTLPTARATIELSVLPPGAEAEARYSVLLNRRETGRSTPAAGEIRGLTVDAGGYLDVFVDSSTLKPGAYAITLRAEGGESRVPEGEIAFVVVPSSL
jgi:hypothetical protein